MKYFLFFFLLVQVVSCKTVTVDCFALSRHSDCSFAARDIFGYEFEKGSIKVHSNESSILLGTADIEKDSVYELFTFKRKLNARIVKRFLKFDYCTRTRDLSQQRILLRFTHDGGKRDSVLVNSFYGVSNGRYHCAMNDELWDFLFKNFPEEFRYSWKMESKNYGKGNK